MSAGDETQKRICVVVLGDFGRSPRMQYHALSLAKNHFIVDVVCYGGSTPHEDVISNPNIKQHILMEPPKFTKWLPRFFMYFVKSIWQFIAMLSTLLSLSKPLCVLVQNPPSVPTLPAVWLYCYFFKVKWIIDWHNYGYTILALARGPKSILVRCYKWCEEYFGKKASYNFCVTEAMKNDILEKWKVKATILYDRPPNVFCPTSLEEKHNLLLKLEQQYPVLKPRENVDGSDETKFTAIVDGTVVEKKERPALIVSSTSWTEDEDFNILLDALIEYENEVPKKNLPDVICIVTGKGPLQFEFLQLIAITQFNHIVVITPWLSAEDYPKLLGCADLGVCLHTSSSGLDLPMKVVDMFGCELPVCAVKYKCLGELVKHGENGLIFNNSKELSRQLQGLFKNFPDDSAQLQAFRKKLKCYNDTRWDQTWERVALPIFRRWHMESIPD